MQKQFRKAGDSMAHKHDVYDADTHFIVDPITRRISTRSKKTKLMRYDHNSERFTFEVPRYIEGHDMSLCDKISIGFSNYASYGYDLSSGTYTVTDMQISSDGDDVIIFSWLISGDATKYTGNLSFGISFVCITDGVADYAWHTDAFDDIEIHEGVNNSGPF